MRGFIQANGVYLAMWIGLWLMSWPLLYVVFRLALRHERRRDW